MSKLKKCPFCGGPKEFWVDGLYHSGCSTVRRGQFLYWYCVRDRENHGEEHWEFRYGPRPTESALLAALKAVQDEFVAKDGIVTATTMIAVRDAIQLAGG